MLDRPQDYGTMAGMAAVVTALLAMMKSLVDKLTGGGQKSQVAEVGRKVDDLHKWHAPDADGSQSWKLGAFKDHMVAEEEATKEITTALRDMSNASLETNILLREFLRKHE